MNEYQNTLRRLWVGRCTISTRVPVVNEQNGQTAFTEQAAITDEPCRLSYQAVASPVETQGGAKVVQTVKLFLDAGVKIPPGSKLTVTQNGETRDYARSGESAVYSNHQEVPLALFGGWA